MIAGFYNLEFRKRSGFKILTMDEIQEESVDSDE